MTARAQVRASGSTGAQEEAHEAVAILEEPVDLPAPDENKKMFRTPAFQRMRTDWRSEDRPVLANAQAAVRGRLLKIFQDAFETMNRIYDVVREPEVRPDGEPVRDQFGYVVWKRNPVTGSFNEDWSRLSRRVKEDLLFDIVTRLFEWNQRAADIWGEAMLAKSQYEERFALDYDRPMSGTVDDRRAVATTGSMDERYFALYVSLLSRKADALVRSMENLAQRLKDTLVD